MHNALMKHVRSRSNASSDALMDVIEEVVVEYYGQATWIMLKKYIRSRVAGEDNVEEILKVIKEFFGGSEEVLDIIFSRYNNDLDLDEYDVF